MPLNECLPATQMKILTVRHLQHSRCSLQVHSAINNCNVWCGILMTAMKARAVADLLAGRRKVGKACGINLKSILNTFCLFSFCLDVLFKFSFCYNYVLMDNEKAQTQLAKCVIDFVRKAPNTPSSGNFKWKFSQIFRMETLIARKLIWV